MAAPTTIEARDLARALRELGATRPAHDAFVGMDESGRIVTWNAQAETTFGWTRDEALGRSLADTIIPETFREAHNRGMQRFFETGDAPVVNKRLELTALHRDGREFPIEITITSPMRSRPSFSRTRSDRAFVARAQATMAVVAGSARAISMSDVAASVAMPRPHAERW